MYPHERSLVKRMQGKPFTLIGVNSDRNLTKLHKTLVKQKITWPSFWAGPRGTAGPIPRAWGVRGWPSIYVLDEQGVIRFKNVRGARMDAAVDDLMAALKDKSGSKPGRKAGQKARK